MCKSSDSKETPLCSLQVQQESCEPLQVYRPPLARRTFVISHFFFFGSGLSSGRDHPRAGWQAERGRWNVPISASPTRLPRQKALIRRGNLHSSHRYPRCLKCTGVPPVSSQKLAGQVGKMHTPEVPSLNNLLLAHCVATADYLEETPFCGGCSPERASFCQARQAARNPRGGRYLTRNES